MKRTIGKYHTTQDSFINISDHFKEKKYENASHFRLDSLNVLLTSQLNFTLTTQCFKFHIIELINFNKHWLKSCYYKNIRWGCIFIWHSHVVKKKKQQGLVVCNVLQGHSAIVKLRLTSESLSEEGCVGNCMPMKLYSYMKWTKQFLVSYLLEAIFG